MRREIFTAALMTSSGELKRAGQSTTAEKHKNRARHQRRRERTLTNCPPYPLNPFCHLVVLFRDKDEVGSMEKITVLPVLALHSAL
ncbi:hypothetical protein SLA2020_307290 [Shorea laevis]